MEKYILILLIMLVCVILGIVYVGYQKLNHLSIAVNKNSNNISAIQSYLEKIEETTNRHQAKKNNKQHIMVDDEDFNVDDNSYEDEDEDEDEEADAHDEDIDADAHEEGEGEDEEDGNLDNVITELSISDNEKEDDIKNNPFINKDVADLTISQNTVEKVEKVEQKNDTNVADLKNKELDDLMADIDNINQKSTADKKKKQVPDDAPKGFDVGYKMISQNDGKEYVITATKTGIKKWKKI